MTRIKAICTVIGISIALLANQLPSHAQANSGRDPNRRSGGDRGECPALSSNLNTAPDSHLTALIPESGETLSALESPTLWFYIPYSSKPPLSARLVIRDEYGKMVMEPQITKLPITSGIVRWQLSQELKINQNYHWYFSILCNSDKPSSNPIVDGWIRRIQLNPTLNSRLKTTTLIEQIALYTQAGLWSDAFTLVANQRDTNSQAKTEWNKLLKAIGLESLAKQTIHHTPL
ncbi:DUF928 domain-containing protein [Pantanalinema sp. GBBB05]|uniref:DUF928 domain-containing protein n=1 Tax=Pantanalinema sp. GBBB05 TaxID=2604139 RepID=UPI001DD47584|nr:DUF928 domain-containing protein [Pantanalinema sp. GBBB05]